MATARKERRINLRASERAVEGIARASALSGVSVSAFIMMSAAERAERTLADVTHFELSHCRAGQASQEAAPTAPIASGAVDP
jgi:uncharacterized protein (DUF1778 family)